MVEVNAKKLGLQEDKTVDALNIKCDPMMIGSLRMKEGFFPAYHMNKENWISILLDSTVSADEIKPLLELSYQLTR
ncbi:MmcQ/YjbR family DNA-binding protein [Phoenicibacter congonensis]|uniref:MmcQ/YjbR family DNA-binding protein n=1 Tax=Phoenicibacter congonensis TaxID=1944646 RepID=UPI0018D32341